MKWSPISEVPDCQLNSPCQHLRKCKQDSVENMKSNTRVEKVKVHSKREVGSMCK